MDQQSEGVFWARLGGLLAILGIALAIVTSFVPGGSTAQKFVLWAFALTAAALIYRGIVVFLHGTLDRPLTAFTILTICLAAVCASLLGSDGDTADPQQTPTRTVTVTVTTAPVSGSSTSTGSTSTPASSATESPTPALPSFDSSDVAVHANGTATLTIGEYGLLFDNTRRWGSSNGYGGAPRGGSGSEAVFDDSGMSGRDGTQFAVLRSGASRSFPSCRAEAAWLPSLTWDQVRRGTFVCVKTPRGRRGLMRFDNLPDFDRERPTVRVTGVTWAPIVDR